MNDHENRKWLIDTGSKNNYISPKIIPSFVKTEKENFVIKTAAGEKKGTDVLYTFCQNNFLKYPKVIKFYVHDFSPNYEVLIGNDLMNEMDTQINFKNKIVKTKYSEFSFKLHEDHDKYYVNLKKGKNTIPIPKKGLFVISLETEKVKILDGLYQTDLTVISEESINGYELNFQDLLKEEVDR